MIASDAFWQKMKIWWAKYTGQ